MGPPNRVPRAFERGTGARPRAVGGGVCAAGPRARPAGARRRGRSGTTRSRRRVQRAGRAPRGHRGTASDLGTTGRVAPTARQVGGGRASGRACQGGTTSDGAGLLPVRLGGAGRG